MKFTIITVSDSCASGTATDTSGPCLLDLVKSKLVCTATNHLIIPDEMEIIKHSLVYACDVLRVNAVFTTGGTGFAPRDVTPEATKAVLTKEAPQLTLAMTLKSMEKTKFAALSRAVCGVRGRTLIVNFPGSKKAVEECFLALIDLIPHVLQLLSDDITKVKKLHSALQSAGTELPIHNCPHETKKGDDDRRSPYPMISVTEALEAVLSSIPSKTEPRKQISRVNIPPFRASVKDGYALKSIGGKGLKRVVGSVAAGDPVVYDNFDIDECYKINTGAPVPAQADAVVQIEDTTLISVKDVRHITRMPIELSNHEQTINIMVDPSPNLDIRPIGSDLHIGEEVFMYHFPLDAVQRSLIAAIGEVPNVQLLKVAILSTGDELIQSSKEQDSPQEGKIFDSNTAMLYHLLKQFGFDENQCTISQYTVNDDYDALKKQIESLTGANHVIICTGGVSMGDKDYVKPVLKALDYDLKIGRVNVKPGKPFTFASKLATKFFGLPGNPVSAFVTFHLFVLPALRKYLATINQTPCTLARCNLPKITVELLTDKYELDPRPEYARASVVSKNGKLFAKITGKQMSSRLKSVVDADVLLHLPGRSNVRSSVVSGDLLTATVIRSDFISEYE